MIKMIHLIKTYDRITNIFDVEITINTDLVKLNFLLPQYNSTSDLE